MESSKNEHHRTEVNMFISCKVTKAAFAVHDDTLHEYGDFCIRLHKGKAVLTPIHVFTKTVHIIVIIK